MRTGKDKWLHAGVCLAVALLVGWLARGMFAGAGVAASGVDAAIVGWLSAMALGAAKECWDRLDYGLFDMEDLLADTVGATAGAVVVMVV